MAGPAVMSAPASTLARGDLLRLVNAGYSDYLVPLVFDETTFGTHLAHHDVDLQCSTVIGAPEPAAIALLARRGPHAWVAGLGTAPEHRRRGLGERALVAALEMAAARRVTHVDLEVLDANHAAIALYEKLGFVAVRDVLVWSLRGGQDSAPGARAVGVADAQQWISAHRSCPDPWQRSEATASTIRACGGMLAAAVAGDPERKAAVVWHEQGGRATVLQIAASDVGSATDVVLAAACERDLRLANIEHSEPASRALEVLGAHLVARQHEMRLAL